MALKMKSQALNEQYWAKPTLFHFNPQQGRFSDQKLINIFLFSMHPGYLSGLYFEAPNS